MLAALAIALTLQSAADDSPAVTWLKANAVAIRTTDIDATDVADLAPLKAAIGDARIVQIGEPSHGDGTGFLLRGRILKYLHRELGFDVVAFESGTFDCSVMMDKLRSDMALDEALSYGVFSIWGASKQCRPFFDYARSTLTTERPLELAGLDLQFSGRGGEEFGSFVTAFFEGPALGAVDEAARKGVDMAIDRLFKPPYMPSPEQLDRDKAAIAAAITQMRAKQDEITKNVDARAFEFFVRCLENLAVQSEFRLLMQTGRDPIQTANLRDQHMGENLVWLANERYAGKKIVVWSANGHCAHDVKRVDTHSTATNAAQRISMGDVAHKALGDSMYTVLMTARSGSFAMVNQPAVKLDDAPAGALEAAIGSLGHAFAFVDLRGARADDAAWSNSSFVARPFSYAPRDAKWSTMADAFLYVDVMEPSVLP
ncbi:MAG: erythromycin esterase family protein [Planctomycetes bacterium]|nr:erythromycin esterase family protein [Planctomycetota bacterium]